MAHIESLPPDLIVLDPDQYFVLKVRYQEIWATQIRINHRSGVAVFTGINRKDYDGKKLIDSIELGLDDSSQDRVDIDSTGMERKIIRLVRTVYNRLSN